MTLPILLLTGCEGQLGRSFSEHWSRSDFDVRYELVKVARNELDITNERGLLSYLDDLSPSVIVNAAAYTKVDKAETDRESARLVNESAVSNLAHWCKGNNGLLFHVSTDFVFDGNTPYPYTTNSSANPLSVYGSSKLAGERHVLEALPSGGLVIRTSWLYSEHGHNFVKTMLRLFSEGRDVKVVDDQIGSPTSAHSLSRFILRLIDDGIEAGVFHFTDGGQISWYEFALSIREIALELGIIPPQSIVSPVPSAEYPTAARRPAYSVLDLTSAGRYANNDDQAWKLELRRVLERIKTGPVIDTQ